MAEYVTKRDVSDGIMQELDDFKRVRENHSRPYRQFGSAFDGQLRSLTGYIDYSMAKFNQFVEIPDDTEDWEVYLAFPNVRNKLMAILARLSAQRMKSEFFPQNMDQMSDKVISELLGFIYDWVEDKSNQDVQNFYWMFETAMKGTGILLEDYRKYSYEVKEVKEVLDDGTSKWKKKKITEDEIYSLVIPLEEFYVWNVREPDVQKQYKCYWNTVMDYEEFKVAFKNYKKMDQVRSGGEIATEDRAFFNEYFDNLAGNAVSVTRIWCKGKDEFKIIANDIELTEEDNPLPFNHKRYPVSKGIYEPIQTDFFYCKSLPDKIGNLTDSIDQLYNDLFNRNQMQLKAPLTVSKGSIMEEVVWRPENIIEYTGDRPETLQIGQSTKDYDKLQNLLFDQLNLSTISPVGQGQVGSGSTAREIVLAEEHSNQLVSMFMRFMEWGEKSRSEQRMSNVLQFLTKPATIEGLAEGSNAYRVLTQNGVRLTTGKIGTRKILFKPESQVTPPEILQKQQRDDLEIIEMSVEFLRTLDLYVKVVPNSSIKISEALKKALNVEYATTMMQLFPNKVNQDELAAELTESYDKNPEKLLLGGEEQETQGRQGMQKTKQGEAMPELSEELLRSMQPMPELSTSKI